jgi:hypothetical protein
LDWTTFILELIDLRSFSNLWYWIALAVMWSTLSHFALGVPYDMVARARRSDIQGDNPKPMIDLQDLVRINGARYLEIVDTAGLWLVAFAGFILTSLAILGFYYWVEFAQAVFLLMFPGSGIALLNVSFVRRIRLERATGAHLCRLILRCRIYTQLIGAASIFVTSMWGMYWNISIGVLGG